MPRSNSESPSEDFQARVREAVASLLEDPRKMKAHVQERVDQMSQRDPEREAKALAGRVAELDKKLSRAQDLATDGLISAHDLREKATAMRAERECAVRKLENPKDDRENIEALKTRSKNPLVACAFALHSGLRYFSAEDYHGIYKRLGLKVRVAPDGALGIEGALGADALPTDARHASRVARLVSEDMEEQGIQGIVIAALPPGPARMRAHVGDTAWAPTGRRMETTTTRRSR